MANAVLNDLFGKKNRNMLAQAKKAMVRSLKAPDGDYYGRLMKIGYKDSGKKDDDGKPFSRFFWMAVLICDEQGNEDCRGEQAFATIDIKANKKFDAGEMFAKTLEVFDKLDYDPPSEDDPQAAEKMDADIAEILSQKPLVRLNINTPEGYDRKFVNLNGLVTQEDVEEALGHSLEDDSDPEGDDEPEGDDLGDEPADDGGDPEPEPEPVKETKPVTSRRRTK
jgi:hypothetical protein